MTETSKPTAKLGLAQKTRVLYILDRDVLIFIFTKLVSTSLQLWHRYEKCLTLCMYKKNKETIDQQQQLIDCCNVCVYIDLLYRVVQCST